METYDRFSVELDVIIRPCRRDDLPTLEWFGLFSRHRGLILAQYARHERGETIMLVAEANGVASGQSWIDIDRLPVEATAVIWAVRVFPALQGLGIGTRLMEVSERLALERGARRVEVAVRRTNEGARRLYERLGYRVVDGAETDRDVDDIGSDEATISRWIMRKDLVVGEAPGERTAR